MKKINIVCRFLEIKDSELCLSLKKKREGKYTEVRPKNFFSPYDLLSKNVKTIGAFQSEKLVGMCSFLKLNNEVIYVTDLLIDPAVTNLFIPNKIFEYAFENIFKSSKVIKILCIEETFKKFDALEFFEKKYDLKKTIDQYIFQTVLPIDNKLLNVHKANDDLYMIEINGKKIEIYTDSSVRFFVVNGMKVKSAFLKSSEILTKEDVSCLVATSSEVFNRLDINYLRISSFDNYHFEKQNVYINRIVGWNVEIDLQHFVSREYLI